VTEGPKPHVVADSTAAADKKGGQPARPEGCSASPSDRS
jgi:hypothetical protein